MLLKNWLRHFLFTTAVYCFQMKIKLNFMNYNLKIHSEDNRYWAECIELKGCNTQGDSLEELIKIRKQPYTTSSIRFSSLLS